MDEFRGTVSLSKPFLEQKEIADFLQISPQSSFPRPVMYRLLFIAEHFIQTRLAEHNPYTELVGLRLSCEFLERTSSAEKISLGIYWTAWGTEFSYGNVLDPDNVSSEEPLDNILVHEELDQLISRVREVLVAKAPLNFNEQIEILTFLDIGIAITESNDLTPQSAEDIRLPINFKYFLLQERTRILSGIRYTLVRSCCQADLSFRPGPSAGSPCSQALC